MVQRSTVAAWLVPVLLFLGGCQSPYRADQGAALGGLLGAGTGAIVGNAVGDPAAGAVIGAGVGALTGAVVGGELDEIEARNRAQIEAQLGRQVAAGAVTVEDAVAMTQAGVNEALIVNHIRAHGTARPLHTGDLIYLQQQGVSTAVVQAMQAPPAVPAPPATIIRRAPPVVVVEDPWVDFWHPYPYHHFHYRRHRPGLSWGFTYRD